MLHRCKNHNSDFDHIPLLWYLYKLEHVVRHTVMNFHALGQARLSDLKEKKKVQFWSNSTSIELCNICLETNDSRTKLDLFYEVSS